METQVKKTFNELFISHEWDPRVRLQVATNSFRLLFRVAYQLPGDFLNQK